MRAWETESWEQLMAEELSAVDPLDEVTEDDAFGLDYEAWEELAFGAKEGERDVHRWELDPASAEDFTDRNRGWRSGPAMRWRHFGH